MNWTQAYQEYNRLPNLNVSPLEVESLVGEIIRRRQALDYTRPDLPLEIAFAELYPNVRIFFELVFPCLFCHHSWFMERRNLQTTPAGFIISNQLLL